MKFDPAALHNEISGAGIPIHGISIVDFDDRNTWAVSFKDEATPEQIVQAQTIIDTFDESTIPKQVDLVAEITKLQEEIVLLKAAK